ncbi:DNA polymerase beta superfamily protein [Kitasatospora sp. NPDC058965]|uniref:nucleotidyltransferase domain-containing protein n=1 Tax=Kitasatospora sp. NPDC058965 TaxID=3346682 RepID=UPI0036CA0AA5
MNVLLAGVVGSTAYGLAHAGSDLDRLGVYAVPTEELHGLDRPRESVVTTAPDRTFHEVAKWCRLALAGNPTASELVWLPTELYEVVSPLGTELIELRRSFLSAPAVRSSYLGYATQQFRKLSGSTSGRRPKHARHLVRLLEQAVLLHETGELRLRVADPAGVRELGERIAADPALAEPLLAAAEDRLSRPGVLPAAPDRAPVEAWLRRVRLAHLTAPPPSTRPARCAGGPPGPTG